MWLKSILCCQWQRSTKNNLSINLFCVVLIFVLLDVHEIQHYFSLWLF